MGYLLQDKPGYLYTYIKRGCKAQDDFQLLLQARSLPSLQTAPTHSKCAAHSD